MKEQRKEWLLNQNLDKFRGSVSTFLIQNGTLKVGDLVVSGNCNWQRLKALLTVTDNKIKSCRAISCSGSSWFK